MKKILVGTVVILAIALTACGSKTRHATNSQNANTQVETATTLAKLDQSKEPVIVFYSITDNSVNTDGDSSKYLLRFIDANGNCYMTENENVASQQIDKLLENYAKGNIKDKLTLVTSTASADVKLSYQKLSSAASATNLALVGTDGVDTSAQVTSWYGVYYDTAGQLNTVLLHGRDSAGDYDSNDMLANDIYDWFEELFVEK